MATDTQSPAPAAASSTTTTTSWRGRGRGRGRGGRGRGGGRGGASSAAAVSKSNAPSRGRGGLRRGRAKHFTDSRVQAAYERQRDLKATYQAVAHALKPALAELAERNVDDMFRNPDAHKGSPEYQSVMAQLKQNLADKFALYNRRLKQDLQLASDNYASDKYLAEQEYKNGFDDLDEQFLDGQENRLRILNALLSRGLPVDVQDDQYEYVVISDEHLDNDFGMYECYKDGVLVPYPSRVEGTDLWQRARNADAAVASAVPSTAPSGRGRGRGRGGIKRRAADQPDGQPTPKKSARLMDDSSMLESSRAPAPAKGLLASAAEVDSPVEGTPGEEDSVPASPEPLNLFNGASSAAYSKAQGKLTAREKSPPLPKNIADADDFGVRIYNQRPTLREKGANNRILAPAAFRFDDWEIGFRDSSNDSTKGHTRVKRGKYLDTPNSNGMHLDHWCNGYDFSSTKPQDFDQELVKKHGIHPKYGIFLPTSTNDVESSDPYFMPGKPKVFIANPSGRISHASRSFQATTNSRRVDDAPIREKFGASMRRFCKIAEIDREDVSVAEFLPTEEELKKRSLGTALDELNARPSGREATAEEPEEETSTSPTKSMDEEGLRAAMSAITWAALMLEAQDASRAPEPAPPTPKPAARYDAIRDIFNDVKPAAPPPPPPAAPQDSSTGLGLSVLAELCNVTRRVPGYDPVPVNMLPAHERLPVGMPLNGPPPPESNMRGAPIPYPGPPRLAVDTTVVKSEIPMEMPPHRAPSQTPSLPPAPTPSHGLYGPMGHQMGPGPERQRYSASREPGPSYPAHVPHNYKTHPPPSVHDLGAYPPPQQGYPGPDPRDIHMQPSRGYEPYTHRRMSGYLPDASPYDRPYWAQQPAPGPPPSQAPPSQYATAPPPSQSRMPFAQNASAEPLPPLRPSRGRNSLPDESMMDPTLRSGPPQPSSATSYYPPGPPRNFHRGYPPPELQNPMQMPPESRILPGFPQGGPGHGPGYMASPPPQPYPPSNPMLSPTFANPPLMSSQLAQQSPPGTPSGAPGSARRHQSTPSGSSDAGSAKYRKLQPAPIPAHRSWLNKQELKTIPYDHKETGSAAALPQSGPTQIRGWNVNAHKKRSKTEKAAAGESQLEREGSR